MSTRLPTYSSRAALDATLVHVLLSRAEIQGNRSLYTFVRGEEQEVLGYRELAMRAGSLAARLIETCQAGDRALLVYPPGLDYIVALFACMYAGVIAVPAYAPKPNRPWSRLESIVDDAQPAIALTNQEQLRLSRASFLRGDSPITRIPWLSTDDLAACDPLEAPDARV